MTAAATGATGRQALAHERPTDPIFALATAPGPGGDRDGAPVGPGRRTRSLRGPRRGRLPAPRRASLRTLTAADGVALDQALVLWLPGPGQLHRRGLRRAAPARRPGGGRGGGRGPGRPRRCGRPSPGEFTRRAFENGKLDLAQAEAVADLIDAETDAQARQALDQLGGALAATLRGLARRAWSRRWPCSRPAIDFPDEELPRGSGRPRAAGARGLLADIERGAGRRRARRAGARGLSHRPHRRAQRRQVAACSTPWSRARRPSSPPIPGTTRDVHRGRR